MDLQGNRSANGKHRLARINPSMPLSGASRNERRDAALLARWHLCSGRTCAIVGDRIK